VGSAQKGEAHEIASATKNRIVGVAELRTNTGFPALQAKAEGYKVYTVMDASGDPSEMASRTTLARLAQAGVVPVSTNAVFCELQRTWNRPDAAAFGALYGEYAPNYQAVVESYQKAQEVLKGEKK
jgi:hypothetical protein